VAAGRRGVWGALRDAVEGAAFALVIAPFLVIPADWTIRAFGWLGRTVLPRTPFARRIVGNVALVRPEWDADARRRIAAGVGDNFGRVLAEYVRMPNVAARPERRRAEGLAHLTGALAAGRGAVLVSAHFGNWEAARLAARDAGVEVGIFYRAFNNRWFDALSFPRIRAAGAPVLHKGREGARAMLGHLKRGGAIMVLLDQRASGAPVLPFMGRPAETAAAVAALCARTGAALIPVSATRDATGLGFDVRFEPEIPAGAPTAMTEAVNARIGAWVDSAPGQWFWLHDRWRIGRRRRGG
jgi:KDO2-lipid IV(A) lauroyltransferase